MTSRWIVAWLFALGTLGPVGTALAGTQPFPADTPPSVVTTVSEPSGIVWHPGLQKLYVVDDSGILIEMNDDGTGQVSWNGLDDIEGVTYAALAGDFVYIARERPTNAILEFDLAMGQVSRVFDLQPWIAPDDDSRGIEAITFVPDAQSPEGGFFYVGVQEDGTIRVFELPIQSSSSSTSVSFVESFSPNPGRTDISGLDFDRVNEVLFVLWDSAERFAAYRSNRSLIEDWEMYVDATPTQEGIAVDPAGSWLYSTEDDSSEVFRFTGFVVDASCSSDPDCEDSRFCNGVEACNGLNECEKGAPPACPGQLCSEALQLCVDCLSDVDCQAGEFCEPAAGVCSQDPPAAPLPVELGEEWRYFKGSVAPPADWSVLGFDDSTWLPGASGFGYGSDCTAERATVLGDMEDGYLSLYLRRFFDIEDAAAVASLTLTLDYDDGFVAYLNNDEVARSNVSGSPPPHDEIADSNHECGTPELFSLDRGSLRTGTNVLAIQAHNRTLGSNDFSVIPELEAELTCVVPEVASLTLDRTPGTRLNWTDLGASFVYDIVGDQLSVLLVQGDTTGATCQADDLPGPTWDDTRADPGVGAAYYYLLRGEQSCGAGSYGSASSGSERQAAADCP